MMPHEKSRARDDAASAKRDARFYSDPDGPAIRIAEARALAEHHVITCLLSAPAKMLGIAKNEGLVQWDFGQPDLRLVYIAVVLGADHGIVPVLRLAKAGLRHFGLWDATTPRGSRGMHWSDATFLELAQAESPNAELLKLSIRRLHRHRDAMERAATLLRQAKQLLVGAA